MSRYEKTLTEYIDDLRSADQKTRIAAALMLGEWGNDRAVSPLIKALSHENNDFRREVARALKEINNRRSIEPMINLLKKDPSPEIRAEVAYCLGYIKGAEDEIDALIDSLDDKHYLVRQNIAFALGKIGRRKSVKPLIDLLVNDENYNVREMAAWSLGELKDKRAIDPLIKALNDSHKEVRKNAAYALGRLKDSKAVESLKNQLLLKNESKEPLWALTKLLRPRQASSIIKETFKRKKKEKAIIDCIEICRILMDIDRKSSEKFIKELLNDSDYSNYFEELKSIV